MNQKSSQHLTMFLYGCHLNVHFSSIKQLAVSICFSFLKDCDLLSIVIKKDNKVSFLKDCDLLSIIITKDNKVRNKTTTVKIEILGSLVG